MNALSDLTDILASFVDGFPWPAMLLDDNGVIRFINREMKSNAALHVVEVGTHLSVALPDYCNALQGAPAWLVSQDVEVINPLTSQPVRICLRKLPIGSCLMMASMPNPELDLGATQTSRLASLGFMVAGVCHEVANPLTAINSMIQLLQSTPMQPETLERGLANIAANVQRVLNITAKLNDFSRCSVDQQSLITVDQPIQGALANAQQRALFRQITIEQKFTTDLWVFGVLDQLEQVFSNILLNAAQAMDGHGHISIVSAPKNGHAEIILHDSGPGIAPGHLSRLFEPFFTTKPTGQGTGLGLAISNEILIEHGGSLHADNHPDGGARFTVRLPLRERKT